MRVDINVILPPRQIFQGRGLQRDETPADLERLRAQRMAEEFEALLLAQMVKEMRKNVPESPIFGRNSAREIFNDFLDGEYGRLFAEKGGIGVAKFLLESLKVKGAGEKKE